MELQQIAKLLIAAGIVLLLAGALLYGAGHMSLPIGRLPGDIRFERPGFRFYFPLTTSILLSVILTLIFFVLSRFR